MRQSFWILLLLGIGLTGCAAPDSMLDRGEIRAELTSLSVLDAAGAPARPQDEPAAAPAAKPNADKPQEKTHTDGDRPEDHEDNLWERRTEAAEIAIIEDQLKRDPKWQEQFRPRRMAVTLYGQFSFADDTSAIDSDSSDDPDWNDLLDAGYGIGLELAYDLVPAVQPLIGIKANRFQGDGHHIGGTGSDPLIRRETDELHTVPVYAGLRLNFPLDLDPEHWFDPDHAGRVLGVIPFLRAAGGVAWVCGQELTLVDKTNNLTTETDFLKRGWTGYVEAAIGIEYRVTGGFAFDLTVGFEHYLDMKLDRSFENLFPNADSESMTVFMLPRLGASYYF